MSVDLLVKRPLDNFRGFMRNNHFATYFGASRGFSAWWK